ncbi:MAG: class D sortase [Terriglobales bacterium]
MSWLRNLERLLLFFGLVMLAFYVAARVQGIVLSNGELEEFQADQGVSADEPQPAPLAKGTPDVSLWSQRRIQEYEKSLAAHFAPAIAVLRIPRIHVEVAVLNGTDELSLNRGVGHVAGTANPGEGSNMAIAGHRDGFFRGLKDVVLGDTIELDTRGRTLTYVIDRISIVDPSNVSVLKPTPGTVLTLVTCYPFYFVGSAPKRYIVQASLADSNPAKAHAGVQSQPK